MVLTIDLLGRFRIRAGSLELERAALHSRKAASLVEILALEPCHTLHRERLCDLLWPTFEPAAASNNLRQVLHQARLALQPLPLPRGSLLFNTGDGLTLYRPDLVITDVAAFEAAAAVARRSGDPEAYCHAIDCYPGHLLPDVLYEDWVEARRETLASRFATLLTDLVQLHQARREFPRALEILQRLVASEPADEEAAVRFMQLAAATGRRTAALKQYRALETALARDLDTAPEPETTELYEAIRDGQFSPVTSNFEAIQPLTCADAPRSNLPRAISRFIGREQEIAEVTALVGEHRLVTLTGPGGIGKTRLALEVAHTWLAKRGEEVWRVDLAALDEPSALPQAIGKAFGIVIEGPGYDADMLAATLSDRHALLFLDNCERHIEDCAELAATLLRGTRHLRILATSRTALRLPGGQRWPVRGLELPDANAELMELTGSDAVALFLDRVRWRLPAFELTCENAADVVAICHRLEGIPFALELAAAKTAVLTLAQVVDRLENALDLLTCGNRGAPSRQQTYRATLDWSYALLDEPQQTLFRRLGVFSGGCTIESTEAVCCGNGICAGDVLGLLEQLVEMSHVQVEQIGDAPRYRLLEPIRQYAAQLLDGSGEGGVFRTRHAGYFLALAERIERTSDEADGGAGCDLLDWEQGNMRAALDWAIERDDAVTVLRLGCALTPYWKRRWMSGEGLAWLEAGLALPPAGQTALRADAARCAAELADVLDAQCAVSIGSLTSREQEIAGLVAECLTNHRIALHLGLSERTVDTHVSNILHKLRLSSRGQIATLHRAHRST